jgi:insertion element IS1 protein InsB
VALREWKKNKVWLWKAYDALQRKIIAWHLGGRTDRSLKKLLKRIGGVKPKQRFVTDDWAGYHRGIPEDQLFTGKDLTYLIESDNARTRRNLARFKRKTQASSRSQAMVGLSLNLAYALLNPPVFASFQKQVLSIFS